MIEPVNVGALASANRVSARSRGSIESMANHAQARAVAPFAYSNVPESAHHLPDEKPG